MEDGRNQLTYSVLLQTDEWIAIDKPWGELVIPGRVASEGPSIRERLEKQLNRRIFVVHRLDRDTTGVLLFAFNAIAHRSLSMAFEAGEVNKTYLALVAGKLESPITIDSDLVPARRGGMRVAEIGEKGGKPAVTEVRPLEALRGATFVEVEPKTGRTHQIRVHLSSVDLPLLVDPLYGKPGPLRASDLGGTGNDVLLERTPLHSSQIVVPELEGVQPAKVESLLPKDMAQALDALRLAK